MAKKLTEDAVRDKARDILGFKDKDGVSRLYYKAFVDELNRHIKTDFSFLLPVKDDGKPDWSYMEQYMRNMMNVSEKVIENLGMLGL